MSITHKSSARAVADLAAMMILAKQNPSKQA
jgi:hypothetical protein